MSEKEFVGALLVTHGNLGKELLDVARQIVGNIGHMEAVSIGWHDDVDESKKRIEEGLRSLNTGKGVIILTDMFGGTPSNMSLSFLEAGKLEIITGVNLPMVIKMASQKGEENLVELAGKVRDQGKKQISIAGELLGE